MANHGYVKAPPGFEMTQEFINKTLERAVREHFRNAIKLEYYDCRGDDTCWGPHVWELSWKGTENRELHKTCFLNKEGFFEVRHAFSCGFDEWVDFTILNWIAELSDGVISDDGVEETWKGNTKKYPTFLSYEANKLKRMGWKWLLMRGMIRFEIECAPKNHRFRKWDLFHEFGKLRRKAFLEKQKAVKAIQKDNS